VIVPVPVEGVTVAVNVTLMPVTSDWTDSVRVVVLGVAPVTVTVTALEVLFV
jgi:hypothetical protein